MKNWTEKLKKAIVKKAEDTAYRSVGRSVPAWIYEVKMPESLRKTMGDMKVPNEE